MQSKHYDLPIVRSGLETLDLVARDQEEEWLLFDYAFGHELDHVFQLFYSVAPDLATHLGALTSALPGIYLPEKKELSPEVRRVIASWRTSYLTHPYLTDQRVSSAVSSD